MIKNKILGLLSVFAFLAFVAPASAEPIPYYYSGDLSSGGNLLGSFGVEEIGAATPTNYALYGNTDLLTGTVTPTGYAQSVVGSGSSLLGSYVRPYGVDSEESYVALFGGAGPVHTTLSYAFDTPVESLSFIWGSIEGSKANYDASLGGALYAHNAVRFDFRTASEGVSSVYFTGEELLAAMAGGAAGIDAASAAKKSVIFDLTSVYGIMGVVFYACQSTFEIARMNVTPVPLPAALPLFGLGLAGLAGLRAKRRKEKASA